MSPAGEQAGCGLDATVPVARPVDANAAASRGEQHWPGVVIALTGGTDEPQSDIGQPGIAQQGEVARAAPQESAGPLSAGTAAAARAGLTAVSRAAAMMTMLISIVNLARMGTFYSASAPNATGWRASNVIRLSHPAMV